MSSQDVYLSRHGARIDREDHNWMRSAGHNRRDDCHLSKGGEVGSAELAAKMKEIHRDTPICHIVSSPFVRCVQTAKPVAEALGLQIKIEPGICEILSTFPPGFLDTEETARNFPNLIDTSYEPVVRRGNLSAEFGDGQAAGRAGTAAKQVREKL